MIITFILGTLFGSALVVFLPALHAFAMKQKDYIELMREEFKS